MRSAYHEPLPNRRRVSLGRRATSFLLALALEILVVIGLLTLAPHQPAPPKQSEPKTFTMAPTTDNQAAPKPAPRAVAKVKHAAGGSSPAPKTVAATRMPVPVPPPVNPWLNDKELFDAGDISKIPSHSGNNSPGTGTDGTGKDSGSAYGPGEGPGGQQLYDAEWYVEPTDAQLAYYLPAQVAPGSWAMIACKTIENYHVDSCRQLGESPVGSGLSRAMRLAAWQFRVRPPRIGGHAVMGAWVRIRIDFTAGGAHVKK